MWVFAHIFPILVTPKRSNRAAKEYQGCDKGGQDAWAGRFEAQQNKCGVGVGLSKGSVLSACSTANENQFCAQSL